ncbi:hypothetical protein HN873_038880 [Arachis hypogaea]
MDADGRNVENGIEISVVEPKGILEEMSQATRLLGVQLPTLEIKIQRPSHRSKIQKVPAFLREKSNFSRYCSPRMISLGPIHHREQNGDLQLGQQFKYLWAFRYIEQFARTSGRKDTEDAKVFLYGTVTQHLQELRNLFSKDVTEGYNNEELVQMLVVDGCALLYFMCKIDDRDSRPLMLKFDQLWCIWREIILLENQLPAKLLNLLTGGSRFQLNRILFRFLSMCLPKKKQDLVTFSQRYDEDNVPTHLLDYILSYYTDYILSYYTYEETVFRPFFNIKKAFRSLFPEADYWHRYKNIGILKKRDVKDLRAAGVLQNLLGSDEDMAKLFNELGHVLPHQHLNDYSYDNKYYKVRCQIDKHCRNKGKTCLAQLRSTYFNTPWSYITFFAAVSVLVLTFLQTLYTIHPRN